MTFGKILIVDDDQEYVKALSLYLVEANYEVVTALDGFQATSTAIKEKPDVILLDMSMPAGDGLVVIDRLKKSSRACAIPIIVISGTTDERDFEKALESGADRCFRKPADSDELMKAIHELTP